MNHGRRYGGKILGTLLALAFALSFAPALRMTAFADGGPKAIVTIMSSRYVQSMPYP